MSGSSGNTIKGTYAIKRDATKAIKTSIPDKKCALCCDVNQPEPATAAGINIAGRAVKYGIRRGDNIDHAGHANSAVREAEVIIGAGLVKGVLYNRSFAGKGALVAVRIVRGTKLFIGVHGSPLVTLWPPSAQVHRTVSPAEMVSVSGTNTSPPFPTATSKIWPPPDGTPLTAGRPF